MLPFLCIKRSHVFKAHNRQIDGEDVKRGDARVQIGKNAWDFRNLVSKRPIHKVEFEDLDYYISFHDPLTKDQVPDYGAYSLEVDTIAMACNQTSRTCWEIAYGTDFDYKHENSANPSQGLIYFADGVPHKIPDQDGYDLYDISHNFHCQRENPSNDPIALKPIRIGNHIQFYFEWNNEYGCPQERTKPPAVPELPDIDCKFDSIIGEETLGWRTGISVDFEKANNGPVGIRSYVFAGEEPMIVYYTPCGYSDCPYTARECVDGLKAQPSDNGVSSLWLCSIEMEGQVQKIGRCVSYGDEQEQPDYHIDSSENEGLTHILRKGDDRMAAIHYDCQADYPGTYVELPPIADEYIPNKSFKISVDSSDVCVRKIPYPQPPEDLCKIKKAMRGPNGNEYKVELDLNQLNHGTEGYMVEKFTLRTIPAQKKTLRFQPCGGMLCPQTSSGTSYNCDGDEDATVWICDEFGGGMGAEYSCDEYGHFRNVSLFQTDVVDRSIMNGIKITYKGGAGNKKSTEFSLKCDDSMVSGTIRLEDHAKVDGNTIMFTGYAKNACAIGQGPTPTPFPIVQPNIPEPIPMPPLNPRPDNDLFIDNGTHFIYIDLEAVDRSVFKGEQDLLENGRFGPIYTEYSPWKKLPCPVGYVCPTGKEANLWACWQLQDIGKTMRCHNAGDINMGVWVDKLGTGTQLNSGVMLSYEGQYSSGADIRLKCKFGKNVTSLTRLEKIVSYQRGGLAGDTFEYTTLTELACPSKFQDPYIPNPPTPTPPPPKDYNPPLSWESPVVNGKSIKMDLNKLDKRMVKDIVIGTNDYFEKVDIYYSPSQRITCPSGFDCIPSDAVLGNVYKCYNSGVNPECFVIGDRSYELNFILNNESNLDDGVRVEYGGGYGGQVEVFMQFWCNHSVKAPHYNFHKVAHSFASRKIIIEVETEMACPVAPSTVSNTTGGAIFLAIVFGGAIVYVFLGVAITFFVKGAVSLPNSEFWTEFFQCVSTGAIFIGTCGKATSIATSSYDTI